MRRWAKPVLCDIQAINQFVESPEPWTRALKDKRVLVVHPFVDSIRQQDAKRERIFPDSISVLPRFKGLTFVKAVQSNANNKVEFDTWFDALESMKDEIKTIDFDIALIGAGAYGIPLASCVKQLGKKAVQMGGITQILFGIYGKRWEEKYKHLINSDWVRPLPSEIPSGYQKVENGCYW